MEKNKASIKPIKTRKPKIIENQSKTSSHHRFKFVDNDLIQALDNFQDGAYISDENYSFLYVSPSLQKMFGPQENKKCFDYLFDRKTVCPWCKNKEVFSGKVVSWEYHFNSNQKTYEILELPLVSSTNINRKCTLYRDITKHKNTEAKLEQTHTNLIEEQVRLKKKNLILREVLNQFDSGKNLLKNQTQANINRFILPIINDLEVGANEDQKKKIMVLRESLIEITSPFINQLETKFSNLSPREIEISKLIKEEYSSKEIASLLGLSVQTIHVRRKHIRNKLGLTNQDINLTAFLKST